MSIVSKLVYFFRSREWFRTGRCVLCGKWSVWILRSADSHEACWLRIK